MWYIEKQKLDNWQIRSTNDCLEFVNVIIGNDNGSIVFLATLEGYDNMRNLVSQANNYLETCKK